MEKVIIENVTANGFDTTNLEYEETGEVGYSISTSEFEKHFDEYVSAGESTHKSSLLADNKVCFKTTISTISHPFQTKTEWDWIIVKIPFNGTVKEKGRPRLYRRSVKYVVFADICYPVDLIITHVEKCAKQGAIAATAAALSGNLSAAQVAFQTAFFACMALSDFPNADKISIRVAGDKIHGDWKPV
jgi:hypothetical protein